MVKIKITADLKENVESSSGKIANDDLNDADRLAITEKFMWNVILD